VGVISGARYDHGSSDYKADVFLLVSRESLADVQGRSLKNSLAGK